MRSAKGSVYRVGKDLWRVQVEAPRDPVTGRRSRRSKTVRGSRRKAEGVRVAMLAEVGDTSEARERMTLQEFWELVYLPDARERLRESTVAGYVNHYTVHVQRQLGGMLLSSITPAVVSSWLASIDGGKRRAEAHKMLRTVLGRAVRRDLIDYNPCTRVDAPRKAPYEFETLDWQDVQVYLWHYERTPIGALVLVVLGAGLTRSEAVGLDWSDIEDGVVKVDNAVTSVGGRAVDGATKNRFRTRSVRLPRSVAARLERLRSEGPICKDSDGGRMNPDNVSKLYRRLQRGLPENCRRVPLKDLRHTSLSLAIDAGADVYAVAQRAGHSSVTTTERFYLKPHGEADRSVSDAMDSLL